jgi:uncharacterized protein YlxW (UPF0749 family)
MNWNATVITAVIAALFGGLGAELIRQVYLSRWKRVEVETAREQALRAELYDEIQNLRQEWRLREEALERRVQDLRVEVDTWKSRYYTLLSEHIALKARLAELERRLADKEKATERTVDLAALPPMGRTEEGQA